jgi:glucose-6-phosphate isomerase
MFSRKLLLTLDLDRPLAMSSNRFGPKFAPLRYDLPTALSGSGSGQIDRAEIDRRLDTVRSQLLVEADPAGSSGQEYLPPAAELINRPARLLTEYQTARRKSRLGRILAAAKQLRDAVDRVVIIGTGGFNLGAQALFGACCHPYHNELGRGDRGGRPRIYFDGDSFDNDATQGLLDLLNRERPVRGIEDRWGLIVIGNENDPSETIAACRTLLGPLRQSCGNDRAALAALVLPVCGSSGQLFELAKSLNCPNVFADLDGAEGRFSVFTAAGLLPAAVMGLDLFQLLRGAAAMIERFRTAALSDNPVMNYVAACQLMEVQRGAASRTLITWGQGLDATRNWYNQFRLANIGKLQSGAAGPGNCNSLITNLVVEQSRRDRLTVADGEIDPPRPIETSRPTYTEMMAAAIGAASQARAAKGFPAADIYLPQLDESALGQFFQMIILAATLEERVAHLASNEKT